jgi:DNA repair exonuclease SbcCD ATPase subunit
MELREISAKDFGPFKEFTLPLHKQGLVWISGQNQDTKAAKSNGSGKSSIFKALTWCLWGESIDKENGDKVIRNGSKEAIVKVSLGDGWVVERTRRKGSPRLALLQPDGQSWKAAGKDVQEKINELVGLDFKAFKNTVLYGQNDSLRFANPTTRDSDRKDMLHCILRTEMLKGCSEYVREEAKGLRLKLSTIQGDINNTKARLEEQNIDEIKDAMARAERAKKILIEDLKQQAQKEKEAAAAENVDVDLDVLNGELSKARKEVAKGDVADKKAAEFQAKIEVLRGKISALRSEASKLETIVAQKDEQLEQLKGSKCPVCNSPLAKGGAGHEHKSKLINEREEASAQGASVVQECSKLLVDKEKLSQAEAEQIALTVAASRAHKRIASIQDEIAEAKAINERVARHIEKAREAIQRARDEAATVNPYVEMLDKAQSRIKAYNDDLAKLRKHEGEVVSDLAHIEFWVRGFSGQGLPSFILDSVMPYITERANHYLETLSDGDIKINFDTQRELKSSKGEYKDEIEISWEIEGLEESYPASGGQLKKIEIATDLALMDLVATREGAHVDILMLDEVLDGLDDEGRTRVLQLLHELRSKRGSIFVISHESDLAEVFEKSVTVVKQDGESILEAA